MQSYVTLISLKGANFAGMNIKPLNILLADDDVDDCIFFDKALKALPLATILTTVHDGEQLMNYLADHAENLPDVLFLDLSMPRKTGFECLSEIKESNKLKYLPVVMCSTSYPKDMIYEQDMINMLIKIGAHIYIRKPGGFEQLKKVIHEALITIAEKAADNIAGEMHMQYIPTDKNILKAIK
jgi:CheY-like chemotaxis protein